MFDVIGDQVVSKTPNIAFGVVLTWLQWRAEDYDGVV